MNYQDYTQQNTARLSDKIPQGSLVLVSAAQHLKRNHDVYYPYRQSSHFYWLTAFEEPQAVYAMHKTNETATYLFHQGQQPSEVQWESPTKSHKETKSSYGFSDTLPLQKLTEWLATTLKTTTTVYALQDDPIQQQIKQINPDISIVLLDGIMRSCRLKKTKIEQELISRACAITARAHQYTIQATKTQPLRFEYQVAATFEYHCHMQGAHTLAYPTIAANGENACILHYIDNQQPLRLGDIILMDAGCQWYNHAADITRCWPVSGKFTSEQKQVYQAVLDAQKACISALKPGVSMMAINDIAKRSLTQSLREIGIIKASLDQALEEGMYYPYYCHSIGHSLGLDVHDTQPKASEWILEEGTILTIEPGLYIPKHTDVNAGFKGLGIRIEDNILITKDGHKNLTQDLVKEIDDIELLIEGG